MEGDRIGPYRVLRTLGVGGMGEVYLAERADAEFEQQVAIKVVFGGALARGVQSRLKIERQILAQLDHPNIAHLLDGGSLPDGTAYIVMEYVDGIPIDAFCDSNRLDIAARLQLISNRLCRGALRASKPHRASRSQALEHLGHGGRACPNCSISASPNYWMSVKRGTTRWPSRMPTFAS